MKSQILELKTVGNVELNASPQENAKKKNTHTHTEVLEEKWNHNYITYSNLFDEYHLKSSHFTSEVFLFYELRVEIKKRRKIVEPTNPKFKKSVACGLEEELLDWKKINYLLEKEDWKIYSRKM